MNSPTITLLYSTHSVVDLETYTHDICTHNSSHINLNKTNDIKRHIKYILNAYNKYYNIDVRSNVYKTVKELHNLLLLRYMCSSENRLVRDHAHSATGTMFSDSLWFSFAETSFNIIYMWNYECENVNQTHRQHLNQTHTNTKATKNVPPF